MAGFVDRNRGGVNNSIVTIKGPLKKLLNIGMDYDDMVVKNKIGIGANEAGVIRGLQGQEDDTAVYVAKLADTLGSQNAVPFLDKDYTAQREDLRRIALHSDIERVLDIIADETIVYDEQNYFAKPDMTRLDDLSEEFEIKLKKRIQDNFEYLYNVVFKFNESVTAWRLFRQYLIEGRLVIELIFNEKGNKIIGASVLDGAFVTQEFKIIDGEIMPFWVVYPTDSKMRRELPDTHVIYISYPKNNSSSKLSYVQGLIRSFNLYRTMENVATIWTIMYSSFRLKIIVPVAGSKQRNEQTVGELLGRFKEDITIDEISGELSINGSPNLNLFKNYAIASKNGQQTEIEAMKMDGYDMSNPETLGYWRKKFWTETGIPYSRLDKEQSGTINIGSADGQDFQEIAFGKQINRFRSDFQEILVKPLWIQMFLDYPDMKDDMYFKSKVSIKFNKDNVFEEAKEKQNIQRAIDFITSLMTITENDKPYFDIELLVEKYLPFDQDFLEKNKKRIKDKAEKAKEAEGGGGGGGGDMGADAGGGQPELPTI